MAASLMMFLVFIAVTLGITYWASRRSEERARILPRVDRSKAGRTAWPWRATI